MPGSIPSSPPRRERGSALVIAMLVTVILAMLGISFLLMGETENRIAQNEKLTVQVFYIAESGVHVVKRWFDDPGAAMHFPAIAEVDRTDRWILDETDPEAGTPTKPADPGWVSYKEIDGSIFDRPYRAPSPERFQHLLLGTEDHPDLRIDGGVDGSPAAALLEEISTTLFADFPAAGSGVRARISRIDIYAPPYVDVDGTWSRYGLATVKVIGRIYRGEGADRETLAEQEVRAVISEVPYRGAYGPLHSGSDMRLTSDLTTRWGAVTSEGSTRLTSDPAACIVLDCGEIPLGIPRAVPATSRTDLLWDTSDADAFTDYTALAEGSSIEDPWLRVLSRGLIEGAVPGFQQPHPPTVPPTGCCDRSNLYQELPLATVPNYDYPLWKSIATSGGSDVHYYSWSSGSKFRENGWGDEVSFNQITTDGEGVYFFDTRDGLPPHDQDGDGRFDNLTPQILLPDGNWSFRGVIYLNAELFQLGDPSTGGPATLNAPGEPYQDLDQDGEFDTGIENWVNLAYPADETGGFIVDSLDTEGGSVMRNDHGPDIVVDDVAFHGIFYTTGQFDATGSGTLYGSLITRQGVEQSVLDSPTPDIYWDESIRGDWPPPGMKLPRVLVTGWLPHR